HLVFRQARHLNPGYPREFAAHHLRVRECVAGPPLLANVEVIEALAVTGMPQLTATLTDRDTRPPLRPPIRAVVFPGRRTGLPFPPLNGLVGRNPVESRGKPVALTAVRVAPLVAVGVPPARRHRIHRRHRHLPYPLVAGP